MFNHNLKASKYKSRIISRLAVIRIDTNKGGWITVKHFTLVLSVIMIVARVIVVYQAHID
jgi:hypothetical protein